MTSCNPVTLLLDPNHNLWKYQEGDNIADISLYQQIIGSLMYLVIGTRPDLAFAISLLSQFSSKPTVEHLGAAKRILRYIKGTRDHTLTYKCSSQPLNLASFTDADYGSNRDDRKSTSGYIFQLAMNTICWRSRKQKCVATSTVEAEYLALSFTSKQQLWLQSALKELGFSAIPSALSTDNEGTVDLVHNPRISDHSKHIDIAYHHVRDLVETGKLTVLHVPGADNLADICTKALPGPRFRQLKEAVLGTR